MRREAPAAARNSRPIADILAQELPRHGFVLEVASGTGEHAVFMARRFPAITWQPSDPDTEALASIEAWAEHAGLENLNPAIRLDATSPDWPVDRADALVCINMIHISPWQATEGLFAGARRVLETGSPLILYGPYFEEDVEPAASNLAFDESLRNRNPEWGIRQLGDIDAVASRAGFTRTARHPMPANNLTLVYRR